MKLAEIRNISDESEILKAAYYLSDNMDSMTYGEFLAMKNTIEQAAIRLGKDYKWLNSEVIKYQNK